MFISRKIKPLQKCLQICIQSVAHQMAIAVIAKSLTVPDKTNLCKHVHGKVTDSHNHFE